MNIKRFLRNCYFQGKDKIIFVTESDHAQPSKVTLPDFEEDAEYEGLIKANGEINWECPCLGGMATGVCGGQFKDAFSCFHVSQSEPKGSECIEQFRTMQECFGKYPEIYGEFESVDENENDKELFNGEDDKEVEGEKKRMSGNVTDLALEEGEQGTEDKKRTVTNS